MKKRIISMLLTVLMVMSLFSGLTVSADAATTASGANVIEYTMAQGDFVLRICQRLGLNYYTCKDAIMMLNNINDGQWNKLAVGRTLLMPASDYDATVIVNSARAATYNSATAQTGAVITGTATTGTSTATTSSVNTASAVQSGADFLAYYLVPYTMSYGETVSGVCNNLGVNFSKFSPFIANVNGISDWRRVRAGDTLIIPTPVCPAVGTTCFGVMAHKVVSNDTAYGIASKNGLDYNATKRVLQALNDTNDLASLKAGSLFLYPKPLMVSLPGTGNPGSSATSTTTTTVTDGNGTTTTTTTTTSTLYKLSSGMSASDGTMLFYVNNAVVTAAPAGATVTVVTETKSGKAIDSLTVKHANGMADLRLSGDSFIMPSCDVRVDTAIKTGHNINIVSNYSGKASASVGGVSVQSAVKGAAVVVRSTDPNYEIQSVTASYNKMITATNKTAISVSASNAFLMPDADVTVEVILKPVSTYSFYVSSVDTSGNPTDTGSFYLQVNGNSVTRAAKGAQVTVVTKALEGYEPTGLKVTKHDAPTQVVNTFSNTFTMPGFDVDVTVTFGAKGNNIIILPAVGGEVTSTPANEANTGTTVTLTAAPETGYAIQSYDVVRNSDGLKVAVSSSGTFTMPKGGVTVTPVFRGGAHTIASTFYLNGTAVTGGYQNCSFTASINRNGQIITGEFKTSADVSSSTKKELRALNSNIFYGDYVDLRAACGEDMAFVRFEITGTSSDPEIIEQIDQANSEANINGYFQMPNCDITVRAYFERGKVAIGEYAVIKGAGDVNYKVWNGSAWKSAAACTPGDTVRLTPKAGYGYRWTGTDTVFASKIIVTRKDNGAIVTLSGVNNGDGTYSYDFTMPAGGVYIQVAFDSLPFTISMRCMDEAGNLLGGEGLWQIAINGDVGAVDNDPNGTVIDVNYEDAIIVAMTESGISKYDMVGFRIDGREYIADVKNYFYNFRMIDERAKNLDIVAILRPKVPFEPALRSLNAVYDASKGNVEFLLLDRNPLDPSQQSSTQYGNIGGGHYSIVNASTKNINPSSYQKAAIPGDYVAILVDSNNGLYNVTADNVYIVEVEGDSNRIIPYTVTDWTIGGVNKTFFVFQMPSSPVNIGVNFASVSYNLRVRVTDTAGNPVSTGFIQVSTDGTSFRDVAADTTFNNVGFGAAVQVMRTELSRAQGSVISSVEVMNTTAGVTVPYYDNSSAGEGIWFNMPSDDVEIRIKVDKQAAAGPVVLLDQVYNGTLVFRTGPNSTDPLATNMKVGDVVYVFDQPDSGFQNLAEGELKIYNNGVINTVNLHSTSPNVWKFTVQPGTTIFGAVFQSAPVTVNYTVTPAGAHAFINGNVFTGTGSFTATVGDVLEIASAEAGYVLTTNDEFIVPAGTATLNINLAAGSNKLFVKSNDYGITPVITVTDSASNPVDINNILTGTALNLSASDTGKYVVKSVTVLDQDGYTIAEGTGSVTFNMPAGGALVTVSYEVRTVNVKFVIPAGHKILVSINGGTATEYDDTITGTIALKVDDRIYYTAKNNAFAITDVKDGISATNNYAAGYVVPNTTASPVTLTFTCNP